MNEFNEIVKKNEDLSVQLVDEGWLITKLNNKFVIEYLADNLKGFYYFINMP